MSMSTRNNHVHILVSIILVGMLLPVFVEAMTADAYLSLVATQRQQNNQRPLNTTETNATVTAWNSLSENQRLYVENRIAAIQANIALYGGNLPIGAAIGVIGNGYDQLPTNEQEILTKDAKDEAANPQKRSSASWCSGIVDCLMLIPSAIGKAIFTLLGGFLLELSRVILGIAGLLFNLLIEKTIIQFGTFYGDMKPAVEQAWTAFRDIANILIIGIFTFIAISIILGLKEYGQKKMIANVLIIAVMINFSLLFAKMIIDASNYTAAQIYTAAALGGTGGTTGGTAGAASTQTTYGIADQYMNLLGVGSVGGSFNVLWDVPGAWATLSHSIFMTMILLGAALVLFYGCFLLASRMIMLIFLMVTASIAFASYLIPKWAGSSYGWSAWWSSLLWCAALAPILMFFLWMTLNVSYALKGTSSPNLSAALSNPSVSTIGFLLNYLLILGLLFGTFKISSMAANKIGGFSMASLATALPFTMANRFLLAPALRQGAGWLGSKYQSSREGQAKDIKVKADRARALEEQARLAGHTFSQSRFQNLAEKYESSVTTKLKRAARGEAFAKSKMNIADTAATKAALGEIGIKGFAAGGSTKDTKSYEDQMKVRAEAAEKRAAKIAPSAEDNDKARREARQTVTDQRQLALSQLEATKNAAKANAEAVKAFEQLPQKLAAAQQNAQGEESAASANKVRIDEALRAGTINQAQHQGQMATENQRIERANKIVQTIQGRIDVLDKPVDDAQKVVKDHEDRTKELGEEAAKTIVAAMGESGEKIAQKIGQQSGNVFERTLGRATGANEVVGKRTQKLYKNKIKTKSLRDVMAEIQADSPPPATTP